MASLMGDILRVRGKTGLDRGSIVGILAIVGSWLYLNRSALYWLGTSLADISLFNGAILVAGGWLLGVLGWYYRHSMICPWVASTALAADIWL